MPTEYEKIVEARKMFREMSNANACAVYDRLSKARDLKNRELSAVTGTSLEAEINRSKLVEELDTLESAYYEAAMRL